MALGILADWPVSVAVELLTADPVVIGSGIRSSKLRLDGALLASVPGAQVVDNLTRG